MKLEQLCENTNHLAREAFEYVENRGWERIPALESTIMKSPEYAYYYAMFIIKDRWPEAEPYIAKDTYYACQYAIEVIKDRWLEGEPAICDDLDMCNDYLRAFPSARSGNKNIPVCLGKFIITDIPNTITDEQLFKLFKLLHPSIDEKDLQSLIDDRMYVDWRIERDLQNKYNACKKITILNLKPDELKYTLMKLGLFYDLNDEDDFEDDE